MDEKKNRSKKHKKSKKKCDSSSSNSESDEWVEMETMAQANRDREDWMSMTGMLKTYTKEDIKPKREDKEKKHIDSYNPATSSRELNPYWKKGGTGLPQAPVRNFKRPSDEDDFYSKPTNSQVSTHSLDSRSRKSNDDSNYSKSSGFRKPPDEDHYAKPTNPRHFKTPQEDNYHASETKRSRDYKMPEEDDYYSSRSTSQDRKQDRNDYRGYSSSYNRSSGGWRRGSEDKRESRSEQSQSRHNPDMRYEREDITKHSPEITQTNIEVQEKVIKQNNTKYLSDEKMNKLAAKIVKAEIMGDNKLVSELKAKLEAAREYRKQNPNASKEEEDEGIMLMSTNAMGNSRPLTKAAPGDARSKGGKRKAETHNAGERQKYFGNDDKYNLAQMFEQEKYGTNYDNDAQLVSVASKAKNPNDDLEDIFTDEISKNHNAAKDSQKERDRAIKQHVKMERSLEGCEYCVDSKNMLKHLMVSCGSKVYLALPAKKSLLDGHCIISTVQHASCVTSVDEDVWEEIMDYRKALTQYFNSQDKDVVFYETAIRLHKFPHMVINCVPLPRDVGDMAAIYFKKALLECETEWSINKKVIELKGKNVRKGVPKGLPYFWVDFAMDPGFAHVIEDQHLFPNNFAEEIIGGFLDIDHNLWKKPQRERSDEQRKKVLEFIGTWKKFDTVAKR